MLGVDKKTGARVAIKVVDKTGAKNKPEMLTNEVNILLKVDHPNIIKLLDLFDSEKVLYFVMEEVTGGELFDRIVEKEQYTEKDAKEVLRHLFDAIKYIHSLGIVHRDLKPENLLLASEKDDTLIKLTDFGLSKIYSKDQMLLTACGTPGYVAPEILLSNGYNPAVDLWSTGVIMYILLCGYPPFYSENDAQLFESILNGNYHFHSPYWDNISADAKDLISKLLVVDPKDRLTAADALQHKWLKVGSSDNIEKIPIIMKDELKKHNNDRKSRGPSKININTVNNS
jgi:calcium/calmodulin-dependent protein kinase I